MIKVDLRDMLIKNKKRTKRCVLLFQWSAVILTILSATLFSFCKYKRLSYECDLAVMGPIQYSDGIGRQSIGLIDCLRQTFSIKYCRHGNYTFRDTPKPVRRIATQRYKNPARVLIYESPLLNSVSDPFPSLPEADVRIAYSMFESTRIPQQWVMILNTLFDAVAVPDSFLVDIYKSCGVRIPIFVVPLGIYLDSFLKESFLHSKPIDRPFVFGNLSAITPRKNQLMLLKAFAKEFGKNPKVNLLLNGRGVEPEYLNLIKKTIDSFQLRNVNITTIALNRHDYLRVFKSLDCYVSPSIGEGFSLQPREALALGLPSIVTDNTAQTTICSSNYVKSVLSEIPIKAVYNGWKDNLGVQFNCSVNDLAAALRDMYANYNVHARKAYEGKNWVKQYKYKRLKKIYTTLVCPKKVILSDRDEVTEDAIYTTSSKLKQSYEKVQKKQSMTRKMLNFLIISFFQS